MDFTVFFNTVDSTLEAKTETSVSEASTLARSLWCWGKPKTGKPQGCAMHRASPSCAHCPLNHCDPQAVLEENTVDRQVEWDIWEQLCIWSGDLDKLITIILNWAALFSSLPCPCYVEGSCINPMGYFFLSSSFSSRYLGAEGKYVIIAVKRSPTKLKI